MTPGGTVLCRRTRLWSAKRRVVLTRPPSPGGIHDASRRAQLSCQRGDRLAACAYGRWRGRDPRRAPGSPDLMRNALLAVERRLIVAAVVKLGDGRRGIDGHLRV